MLSVRLTEAEIAESCRDTVSRRLCVLQHVSLSESSAKDGVTGETEPVLTRVRTERAVIGICSRERQGVSEFPLASLSLLARFAVNRTDWD